MAKMTKLIIIIYHFISRFSTWTMAYMLQLWNVLTISICVAYLYGFFWLGQHMKEDEHKIEKDILKESEMQIAQKYYHAHFNPYP